MKVFDLSHPFSVDMTVFPGTPAMSRTLTHTVEKDGYNLGLYSINSHAGTHTDAPRHYIADGDCLSDVPPSVYVGYTFVADCTAKAVPKSEITPDDLRPFEAQIRACRRVILRTGWAAHYEQPDFYTDYPVITEETAAYLVSLGIVLVGTEAPSVNPAKHHEVHTAFLSHRVAIVESLCNLEQLPTDTVLLSACPLAFAGADGFPVRAVAIVL